MWTQNTKECVTHKQKTVMEVDRDYLGINADKYL